MSLVKISNLVSVNPDKVIAVEKEIYRHRDDYSKKLTRIIIITEKKIYFSPHSYEETINILNYKLTL